MHTERQKWIDAARGIAILLMLWGHNSNDIFTHWLYYFHMPLFVFISGYVFSPKADYIECLKSQLKRLYIPYIVYFSIDFFLNWAYEFLIYSNHPIIPRFWKRTYEIILPLYGTGTTNGLWFLISLSWILLLAQCILTRKIYIKWMIVIFAIISYMGIWGVIYQRILFHYHSLCIKLWHYQYSFI